ncbi:MAG: methylenetetrahydrofolate--tRNA-(uracil(54)-C(5))-methyltransferase (FADH(2)-oxidizing) TrmFO [Bryobacterales bacterium]|nr:methylenetetrahydrofolate--tRNA-(uracil(54)-C(5))-methyltransferase (FADH(2)-oxidizing) TrmFO [Bryobacterales bacterium]
MVKPSIIVAGAGLAGSEAAWQIANAGFRVLLYEMRPVKRTPAHQTGNFGELVCSNSLKSDSPNTAPWQLKREMRRIGSLLMRVADEARVPGGNALTVDRERFSAGITTALEAHPLIEIRREELTAIPAEGLVILATGPLTSDALAESIARHSGSGRLFFYDSISPIVWADSINMEIAFRANRYDRGLDGTADYINCPFDRPQYEAFLDALAEAQQYSAHIPEDVPYFESCLPIEELARRGKDTLRFGPMKPVGLTDPRTGRWPYAAVQLRQENARADSFNLVGFQNYLRFGEQQRVFRLIPGLEGAEFVRFGQIHRNTYINAPALLNETLQLRNEPRILFAGQICGVEGYVESIATGLMAGIHAVALAQGGTPRPFPRPTALGSLCHYMTHADSAHYQPANITFDLLPPLDEERRQRFRRDRKARHAEVCREAANALAAYLGDDSGEESQQSAAEMSA